MTLDLQTAAAFEAPKGTPAEVTRPAEPVPLPPTPAGRVIPLGRTVLAGVLSVGAACFLLSGVFAGVWPRLVAVLSVALGGGLVYLSVRTRKSWIQYLVVPAAVLAGALLVVPEASGQGSANLPGLVVEAVRAGGLLQPPVPFDPGWRFVLVVLAAVFGAGVPAATLGFKRPKLAALLPLPLVMAGELLQPPAVEVVATAVALGMLIIASALAYGADMMGEGVAVSRRFETRRLLRSGATAVLLVGLVVGLSRTGILFPQPEHSSEVPPQKPHVPPPAPDRALFSVRMDHAVPLSLGVLDIYDQHQNAWLLPAYDTRRYKPVTGGKLSASGQRQPAASSAIITVLDAGGHVLPTVGGAVGLEGVKDRVEEDPRTAQLRLADRRVYRGLRYTLSVAKSATGQQLVNAPAPPAALNAWLDAPLPPNEVVSLLAKAPTDAFDRMQVLRQALYTKVVAAGPGVPVDITSERVAKMLNGGEASPYEITAGEALLARWAGVPSRIGYGYYGGDKQKDGSFEIHPRDGSTWLETYFDGYGWVPIVGVPLKAKPSTDNQDKNKNPSVQPSDNISLLIYVPVRIQGIQLLYEVVRYYIGLVAPWVAGVILALLAYPGFIKIARFLRRRAWARRRGARGRILAAYAELRDMATDLGVGHPTATPLEFTLVIAEDKALQDLAWLVTRVFWGDLSDDLTAREAERAEELALSVGRRILQAQNLLALTLAFISKGSLREPYSDELPNLWRRRSTAPSAPLLGRVRRRAASLLPGGRRLAASAGALLLLAGCGSELVYQGPSQFRSHLVPERIVGGPAIQRERQTESKYRATADAIAAAGQVYTLRDADVVEGSIQLSLLKPDVRVTNTEDDVVFKGMNLGIGGRRFSQVNDPNIAVDQVLWVKELTELRIYMWFPPQANTVELVILRKAYTGHRELVRALIDYQHGRVPRPISRPSPIGSGPGPIVPTVTLPVAASPTPSP